MINSLFWPFLNWLKHHNSTAAAMSLRYRGALKDDGWFRSVAKLAPVDAAGDPIPWISYPALHFLASRTQPDMQVFEFGSGYSTLWWAARVRRVIACECDPDWHKHVQELAPKNVELVFGTSDDHRNLIAHHPQTFDVVTIDGENRVRAAECAAMALNDGGVILWDDTERPEYASGFEYLRQKGFSRIPFVGQGPVVNISKETSIFYRPGNVLAI
jgi:hypothetical protein